MYIVVPPRRNVSHVRGSGVLEASTNTLIPSMPKPLLSRIGNIASLNSTNNIHIVYFRQKQAIFDVKGIIHV